MMPGGGRAVIVRVLVLRSRPSRGTTNDHGNDHDHHHEHDFCIRRSFVMVTVILLLLGRSTFGVTAENEARERQ